MWNFSKVSPQETRGKSKLADFFETNTGNAGDAESLIRESLQNALDAKSQANPGNPVTVRITVGQQSRQSTGWLFDIFDTHLDSVRQQVKPVYPVAIPDNFTYVLIEDFNTTGFDGTFDNEDDANKGSLVRFWWEEGTSQKVKGGGGSHGVGKITLSEASKSRVFFGFSIREEDVDDILFGYCRLGMHTLNGKRHREYARFGVMTDGANIDSAGLRPYSRLSGNKEHNRSITRFRNAFGITREAPGASVIIPNIDTQQIGTDKLVDAVIDNFYLPILKGLLTVEINDTVSGWSQSFDKVSFVPFSIDRRLDDPGFKSKIELAQFLIKDGGFYSSTTDFDFTQQSGRVCNEIFSEERLKEIRDEYAAGKPVKVKLNVKLFPADHEPENGFFHIVVQRRKNHEEDPKFYAVFRGDINIRDEGLGTSKANGILDVFGAHDEALPNPLSEFMKYCEDPGHRNWNAAINRRNEPLHYKSTQTWQKQLVRTAVRDLVGVLENEDDKRLDDFADDIFFFVKPTEHEAPGANVRDDGVEQQKPKDKVAPQGMPDVPKTVPLVSISRFANGIRLKSTSKFKEANVDLSSITPIESSFCYEMLGASKAVWRRYGKMEIDLTDSAEFNVSATGASIVSVEGNRFFFRPTTNDFEVAVTGFDPNRQLYVDVKDGELAQVLKGPFDDNC